MKHLHLAMLFVTALTCGAAAYAGEAAVYADEDRDWGVAPTKQFRVTEYHAPTPKSVPGGKVVTTAELKAIMDQPTMTYVIDVLGGMIHTTVARSFWLPGAGAGDLDADEQKRFLAAIAKFAGGDKARPMVFFCSSAQCWLSYNAAMRAAAAGYTNVMWYRGGIDAWRAADLPVTQSDPFAW